MKQNLKDIFPEWVNDGNNEYNLCLSNDIDSLLSCALLFQLKGYEINHFYDFGALYTADRTDNRKAIGVDIALSEGRCWDNHVTMTRKSDQPNPLSANPNNLLGIHADNNKSYVEKYAMSTALLIYSYYDIPLPRSEEGKMLLLAIDTGHQGHWRFPRVHNAWLERLQLTELADVLKRHDREEFDKILLQHNLHKHLQIKDHKLVTSIDLIGASKLLDIDLSLDNRQLEFKKVKTFDKYRIDKADKICYNNIVNKIFSSACVSMNNVSLSTFKKRGEQ